MTETQILSNIAEFSVSELAQAVKRQLEGEFPRIRVRGEISKVTNHASGHIYFDLKDTEAVIKCCCWKSRVFLLTVRPEQGSEVVVTARLSTYGPTSSYQLIVERIELAGVGALLKTIEDRRKRLEQEGLFVLERKRPLPTLPGRIGVVTSPQGAVIRDILHRLRERFPCHVVVWPVPVQGPAAAGAIVAAIEGFNRLPAEKRPELLIIARGGGSLEDLMSFNDEALVRAVCASAIPVISAIGHETDTTLIDYAADLRAPTPTAAAEKAVPVRRDLDHRLQHCAHRHHHAMTRLLRRAEEQIARETRALADPRRLLDWPRQRLDDMVERWHHSFQRFLDIRRERLRRIAPRTPREQIRIAHRHLLGVARAFQPAYQRTVTTKIHRLERAGALLESFSYQNVLQRGFALVRDREGHPVFRAASVQNGQNLKIEMQDGSISVQVEGASARH
ncbi:MAG TPA: exodeoxyribonuclease VII large subunit [Dongiaceae bacterium]|jgi:exodeoxyribonuclease VII large subunit|nr:exodeoxyribonuclease VII large subunit [Dongiaceae bacterium]